MDEKPEFEFSVKPHSDAELAHYVIYFKGYARCWDDELGDDKLVGELDGVRLDFASAIVDGVYVDEMIESVSPDLADFKETVFENGKCILPDEKQGEQECESLVFINRLYVVPEARGHGIGTELMHRMSEMIDLERTMIGLKAYPLSEEYGSVRTDEDIQQVKHFYEKLGFIHSGNDFMKKNGNECYAMKKRMQRRNRSETLIKSN